MSTASTNTAHPHVDAQGWIMAGFNARRLKLCYEFLRYPLLENKAKSNGLCDGAYTVGRITSSHATKLSYFHSFGLTDNYIVFLEQCLLLSLPKFFVGLLTNKTFADALVMRKTFKTRIHLIDRRTGKRAGKAKYRTEPLFLFHHINAYENKDNELLVDVCAYDPEHFDIKALTYADMFTERLCLSDKIKALAKRIHVPLSELNTRRKVNCPCTQLNATPFELPVINYAKCNGRPYKYVYGFNFYRKPFSIVKVSFYCLIIDNAFNLHDRLCILSIYIKY